MDEKLIIDVKTILEQGLSFEEYFIIYCVYKNDENLLHSYRNNVTFPSDIFNILENKGFLNIKRAKNNLIFFESLSLTQKATELMKEDKTGLSNFDEFRSFYPKIVHTHNGVPRRLHGNLKRAKELYNKLLLETTHDILCKAAKLYHQEKIRANSEMYMQDLSVWLNQKNYLLYVDDITNNDSNDYNMGKITNVDAI